MIRKYAKVHLKTWLTRAGYVKGKNVDKSWYQSFFVEQQLGKYLTMIAKSLHRFQISDLQADSPKIINLCRIWWPNFGHFAQSLHCTTSPAHRTKLSTKLSTVSVENHSRSSEDPLEGLVLSQLRDWPCAWISVPSRVARSRLGAGKRLHLSRRV